MISLKKTAHRQSWFGIALLFTLFLVAGNFFIYQQQHDSLFSSFENSQQNVVKLLTQLARESLITENFALIEWYFNSWGKGHSEVVTLTLVNEDGFALSTYNRPSPSVSETFTSSGSITVNHDRYDLTLTSEPIVTTQLLNSLIKQLALISSIATMLLGITTWFLFHKFSITPLLHEIERRRNAEHEIAKQHRLLQSVINGVHDGIMLINTDYEVELINDSAAGTEDPQLFNDQQQPIHCYEISHNRDTPCDGDDHPCPLRQVKLTGKHATTLHNHPDESGNDRFFELLASPLFDDNGKLTGIIESSREMTSHILLQHEIEEKSQHLDHLAHHDTLTSLPNRLLFLDRLEQTLLKARRNGELFALFFIDLDQFKQINDSVGHSVGDKVLIQTGKCLQQCIRADDTIARLGGDEFTIILTSVNSPDDAASVAQKVIEAIKEPMDIDGNNYHLTASIGISIYPQDADSCEMLIRNADAAMFKVKERGRNSYQFYTEDLTHRAMQRMLMENGIRKALTDQHFVAWYQPQYDIETDQLIGMEALARWISPDQGIISPLDFIPLAEETGLILELGEQILDQVMQQAVSWHEQGLNPGRVAINVSGKQLLNGNISATVKRLLEQNRCRVEWIEIEVTEGFVMGQGEGAIEQLQELQALGVQLSIDDFGTGYSSLAYLKQLPISKLKIDKSFVDDLPHDLDDAGITRAVIALANSLGLDVIAEGVESREQADFLLQEGCPLAQGYLYSKPLPADKITALLKKG